MNEFQKWGRTFKHKQRNPILFTCFITTTHNPHVNAYYVAALYIRALYIEETMIMKLYGILVELGHSKLNGAATHIIVITYFWLFRITISRIFINAIINCIALYINPMFMIRTELTGADVALMDLN